MAVVFVGESTSLATHITPPIHEKKAITPNKDTTYALQTIHVQTYSSVRSIKEMANTGNTKVDVMCGKLTEQWSFSIYFALCTFQACKVMLAAFKMVFTLTLEQTALYNSKSRSTCRHPIKIWFS